MDTLQKLKADDLLFSADITVWSKDGQFIELKNNVKLPGILRDSCVGEAPEIFIRALFNSLLIPLRQEAQDKINQHHGRKPLDFNQEYGITRPSAQIPMIEPSKLDGGFPSMSLGSPGVGKDDL